MPNSDNVITFSLSQGQLRIYTPVYMKISGYMCTPRSIHTPIPTAVCHLKGPKKVDTPAMANTESLHIQDPSDIAASRRSRATQEEPGERYSARKQRRT